MIKYTGYDLQRILHKFYDKGSKKHCENCVL